MFKVTEIPLAGVSNYDYPTIFKQLIKGMLDSGQFTLEGGLTYQNVVDMKFGTKSRENNLTFNIKFQGKILSIVQNKSDSDDKVKITFEQYSATLELNYLRHKSVIIANDKLFFIVSIDSSARSAIMFLSEIVATSEYPFTTSNSSSTKFKDYSLVRMPAFAKKGSSYFLTDELPDVVNFMGYVPIKGMVFKFDGKKYFYLDYGLAFEVE